MNSWYVTWIAFTSVNFGLYLNKPESTFIGGLIVWLIEIAIVTLAAKEGLE